MRKFILILLSVLSIGFAYAQGTADTALANRIEKYLRLSRELKFTEIMDVTYPKIFELATREQLIQMMTEGFDNEDFRMTIDSTFLLDIGAPFTHDSKEYKKVKYRMVAGLQFKDTATASTDEEIQQLIESFEASFSGGTVEYNKKTRWFRINHTTFMFAIKDPNKPWLFLGYQNNPALITKMYPAEVIKHFNLQ